jgi:hypothetical protein
MTAKETTVRQENRLAATDYLKKATDNYEQMLVAYNAQNWNAASTLAVQCAISSADAVCVHHRGVRSVSQDHFDVCELVSLVDIDGAEEKSKQLRKVIARKNMVQYESRSARQSDADEMVKVTTRFYQWVLENLR